MRCKIPCWKIFVRIILSSYTVGKFLNMRSFHSAHLEMVSGTHTTITMRDEYLADELSGGDFSEDVQRYLYLHGKSLAS